MDGLQFIQHIIYLYTAEQRREGRREKEGREEVGIGGREGRREEGGERKEEWGREE